MTSPGRYRLTLYLDGRPVMHGWWNRETTARKKFRSAVGDYGHGGATIRLVDTETGEELASWPTPVVGGDS
ncbi:hypothetical protein ACFZAR_37815 [Streptomyces sp. NPDC008222]|uniref:hypothetical protein n=1 Tax=Streptomyces sp. NPDC008222 TaxID=3364820 RepID=UPI0036E75107